MREREKAKAVLLGAIVSSVITTILSYVLPIILGNNSNDSNQEDEYNKGQQIRNLIEIYKSL